MLYCIPGSQRAQATGDPPHGSASAATTKPQLNGSRPHQTPVRSSLKGPTPIPALRLPRKPTVPARNLTEGTARSELSEGSASTQGEPSKDSHHF